MEYWIVFRIKNHKRWYVSGTDEYGYPEHSYEESKAWHFKNFDTAMSYFNLGYTVEKHII